MTVLARFEQVTKHYRTGCERGNVRAALPGGLGARIRGEYLVALDGVTFDVSEGEAIGVIGRNGAGKSTLLKLLTGVLAPTSGRVLCPYRVASFLDLSAGFHPDLTGAENLQVGAALLGVGRRELRRKWDEIVSFAGVGERMDTPVKRYSSGMRARLGFALASHVDAEVLAIDEVLGVGDAEFQRRCYDRCRMLLAEGVAVVLVSHNLWVIAQMCTRVLRLEQGRVVDDGTAAQVIERYEHAVESGEGHGPAPVRVDSLEVRPRAVSPSERVDMHVLLHCERGLPSATVAFTLLRPDGHVIAEVPIPVAAEALASPGMWSLQGSIAAVPLTSGRFIVAVAVHDGDGALVSRATDVVEVVGGVSLQTRLLMDTDWQVTGFEPRARRHLAPGGGQ